MLGFGFFSPGTWYVAQATSSSYPPALASEALDLYVCTTIPGTQTFLRVPQEQNISCFLWLFTSSADLWWVECVCMNQARSSIIFKGLYSWIDAYILLKVNFT